MKVMYDYYQLFEILENIKVKISPITITLLHWNAHIRTIHTNTHIFERYLSIS